MFACNDLFHKILEGIFRSCRREQPRRTLPKRCRGPGIDGFYHLDDGLRALQEWGLLEVFGVEVLDQRTGRAQT
jgi:hypothetical protein